MIVEPKVTTTIRHHCGRRWRCGDGAPTLADAWHRSSGEIVAPGSLSLQQQPSSEELSVGFAQALSGRV